MQPFSFPTTISARQIQRGYKKVFDTVKKTKQPIVVMANNKPQAAIVSVQMLREYKRLQENEKTWAVIDQIRARNADKDPDEVYKDVTRVVEEVRQEMYDKAKGNR